MPGYKDKRDGTWRYRKWVVLPSGNRTRITGTPNTDTKVAAEAAERAHIDRIHHPERFASVAEAVPSRKEKTIREHAVQFLASYRPETKPSEQRTKKNALDSALLPFFGELTIEGLKQTDIDTWTTLELKRGMAIKTVNNRLAILSTLIRYSTGEKSKLRFTLAGMIGELSAVATCDIEKLLGACTEERHRAIILLASEAGLRAGEIRGLQWGDVKDGQLTIRRALDNATNAVIAPKHNKARTIPLSPRLTAVLAALPRRGVWVVSCLDGELYGYWGMLEAVHGIYDRARVARPRKVLHCLRHSFGTVMARKVPLGVLQKLMGHADVATTIRYVDISEADKRQAIAAVFGAERQPMGDDSAGYA